MFSEYKRFKKWEIYGFIWLVIAGFVFHFFYDWSGKNDFVGLLSPVNESVWEHLKLGFTPVLVFMIFQILFMKDKPQGFFFRKTLGLIFMLLFIVCFHYGYTFILGKSIPWLDMSSFIIGAFISQFINIKLIKMDPSAKTDYIFLGIYIILGILFIVFTFTPPHLEIFRDPSTNKYGINK